MKKLHKYVKVFVIVLAVAFLSGCTTTQKGNSEYYFEFGTKVAAGVGTQKADDTQTASQEIEVSPFIETLIGGTLEPKPEG